MCQNIFFAHVVRKIEISKTHGDCYQKFYHDEKNFFSSRIQIFYQCTIIICAHILYTPNNAILSINN